MKANKTTLSIRDLQKTLGLWKRRKITDSTEAKLLELYLGMTAYMNEERVYPVENFYDISQGLRFKNTRCMIEAVKLCGSFGMVSDGNIYGMKAFYSVLWCEAKPQEKSQKELSMNEELPNQLLTEMKDETSGTLPGRFPTDDIYNNITPKGGDTEKTVSSGEAVAAVKAFFHLINEAPEQKEQILTPLIDWFQLHERLTRSNAYDNLVYLVNELLVPYFVSQIRFMKSNHVGRLCWLRNLLKSPHGQHLLNDAARAGRLRREQDIREKRINQRNNHPVSPFEWTDEETDLRFYDDEAEGAVNIPDGAQPRPSEQAVWNVLSGSWQ